MADLSSILGGMIQGFKDFGTGVVDMFGTGGAAIGDLFQSGGRSTKNQDDFRKWLYQTDDTQDAAAKGLGTILNGVQTVADVIPGAGAITRNPLFNGVQGAIGGVADEFKMAGKDYDLGRAAQRAGVGAASGLASAYTNQALGKTGNKLINNGLVRGAAGGALAGGIANAGYTGIEGGSVQDMINAGLYGAQTGALVGGTTGLARELIKPNHKMDVAFTDEEKAARIKNAQDQIDDLKWQIMNASPDDTDFDLRAANNRIAELRGIIDKYQTPEPTVKANSKKTKTVADLMNEPKQKTVADLMLSPEQEEFFKGSVMRDENGKLMRVYHSSPNKFTTFDDSKLGENTAYTNTAFGHFVTPDADFSSRFMDIDNKGTKGNMMELYANVKKPITHPYNADYKYKGADLDNIVENYFKATDDLEDLNFLKQAAKDNGTSLYEAYVDNMDIDSDPFEAAQWDREALMKKGYDAVEMVEGLKSGLVDGSADNTPVSSYAVFSGNQLKDVNNLRPTADADIMYSKVADGQTSAASSSDGKYKRIGSADVAPINPETLPDSLRMANEYINEGYIKDIEKTMGKPYGKMTDNDFLEYSLRNKKPEDREFFKQIINDMVKDGSTTYEKYAKSAASNKYLRNLADTKLTDMDSDSLMRYLINNKNKLTDNFTKAADAELSDRLGIGRSNTLMMDNSIGTENAYGVYNPTNSTMSLNTRSLGEGDAKTSVAGHERLHSFQTEARIKRYSPEVVDAYKNLRKELRAANAFKNKQEIKDYWGEDIGYYHNNDEQEARMFQQYLEKKGFTDRAPKSSNKVYHEKNVREFDNSKITPAFDKFLDKLRALSKKGVALPAITALFGGGAIAGALTSGKDDKKKKSEVK